MLGVAWGGALLGWGRGRLVRPLPCLGGGRPGRLWAPRFPSGVPLWGSPVGGLSSPLGGGLCAAPWLPLRGLGWPLVVKTTTLDACKGTKFESSLAVAMVAQGLVSNQFLAQVSTSFVLSFEASLSAPTKGLLSVDLIVIPQR